MTDKFLNNNDKYIEDIQYYGKSILGDKFTGVINEFIRQYYLRADAEYMQYSDAQKLFEAAYSNFIFLNSAKSENGRRVRVYNPSKDEHGWESDRTVVECNLPDSPFILDSITQYLFNSDRILHEVLHPIINVKRDANGKIIDINPDKSHSDNGFELESVIQIQIGHISIESELDEIAVRLNEILECVHLCVEDWRPMEKKVLNTISNLDNKKKIISASDEVNESIEFLRWALDGNFIFLGYRDFDFSKNKEVTYDKESQLGIFRSAVNKSYDDKVKGIPYNSEIILRNSHIVEITKSSRKSVVHRPVHMDYIGIKKYDDKGKIIGEERFLGLFTSKVYYQPIGSIPIIRQKLAYVLEKSNFRSDSHNGKALAALLESHPRDELLQSSEEELFEIGMGIVTLSEKLNTKIFIRRDRFFRFYSCILFIPRDFFTTSLRESIQTILEEELGGSVMDYYTQVTDSPLARVNVLVRTIPDGASDYLHYANESEHKAKEVNLDRIQQRVIDKTNSWVESLSHKLMEKFGEINGEKIFRAYRKSFSESYKDNYHPGGASLDIAKIENVYKTADTNNSGNNNIALSLYFDLYHLEADEQDYFQLKLFSLDRRITLSDILPIIENLSFKAIDEATYRIHPTNQDRDVWLHHFRIMFNKGEVQDGVNLDVHDIKSKFEEALLLIWNNKIENDELNKLVSRANLSSREINILRAYTKYIIQMNFPYSREVISRTLCKHPRISALIVDYFYAKFTPDLDEKERKLNEKEQNIVNILDGVSIVTEYRILKHFLDVMKATLRTNFFQKVANNSACSVKETDDSASCTSEYDSYKSYISFKIKTKEVPNAPSPKPYAEIFVYSYDFEGTHLRGGKVARGGLRWSDRLDDFRTEVLGLVKAQMVKNAVIVPVGSKGGFVVKESKATNRDEAFTEGKEIYKKYLSGLLDITDNIIEGEVVNPLDTVRYDDNDPYLVVAADKGTATFSDTANGVAAAYNFWLDDAFASGGSVGYDHKKMGITAKGAWVSVKRHFREMGKDCQKEDFTCIGIGDMAGDVFGNGMLLSKHIKLVAAFNHMHIFIDPNPDAASSYTERKRMFELPKSSWLDYDSKLISKGGGVFERSAKSIKISKEIQELLDIDSTEISPEQLIRKILKANVELLWNGGIGTYVKASSESNSQVGDKANDSVRVDANEIRSKIIAEGGNLGLTQDARVEYALRGGRINTDAIDNSAGVDCSDHEVNIKIALGQAIKEKVINTEQRNKLLEEMTTEVERLVIRDNELQTLAISIIENKHSQNIEDNIRLMEFLESSNILDRNLENLPTNESLISRKTVGKGLTRPEISVLLAYSKMFIFDDLISSNLPDDEYFETDLMLYFPQDMREKFIKQIKSHQLRREIITTFVSNSIVNRMGTTFYQRMKEETGLKGCDISRAYTVVRDIFDLRTIWDDIEEASCDMPFDATLRLYEDVNNLVEKSVKWFLQSHDSPLKTNKLVANYRDKITEISENIMLYANDDMLKQCKSHYNRLVAMGVSKDLANKISMFDILSSAPDIVYISDKEDVDFATVANTYYEIGDKLKINWLKYSAKSLLQDSHWDNLAIKTLISSFGNLQMKITSDILHFAYDKKSKKVDIRKWLDARSKVISRYRNFIDELEVQKEVSQSMLTIAVERISGVLSHFED